MIKIAPSILSANSACLCDEVKKLEQAKADKMEPKFVSKPTRKKQVA